MSTQPQTERHIALLIDGDNAQYKFMKEMLEEVSRYGTATYRRAYGDWTTPNLANWRDVMLANAIQPIQQFRYTTGKNATDSALIIDAMDILSSGTVHGFCIVSSDSDYTRLCTRIRESGLFVMGVGENKTPEAFIKACDIFVYVENLTASDKTPQNKVTTTVISSKKRSDLINLLQRAFHIASQEEGLVYLGILGQSLRRIDPSFDSRSYGYTNLSKLIKDLPEQFIIEKVKKTGASSIYVRMIED
jgi:uncharacterized LabA/DUF88 family protein